MPCHAMSMSHHTKCKTEREREGERDQEAGMPKSMQKQNVSVKTPKQMPCHAMLLLSANATQMPNTTMPKAKFYTRKACGMQANKKIGNPRQVTDVQHIQKHQKKCCQAREEHGKVKMGTCAHSKGTGTESSFSPLPSSTTTVSLPVTWCVRHGVGNRPSEQNNCQGGYQHIASTARHFLSAVEGTVAGEQSCGCGATP